MKDEIKEIKIKTIGQLLDYVETEQKAKELINYITNLQEENEELKAELQEEIDSTTWWHNRYKALEQVNKKLKVKLNCKECFSSTLPENTEFVILTKENYDRQQKDIELELIDYKQRNEKAIEYIKDNGLYEDKYNKFNDDLNYNELNKLLNILNGDDK